MGESKIRFNGSDSPCASSKVHRLSNVQNPVVLPK